jgi:hypothetical protein
MPIKIPVTPSEIEPATFRLVAQCLNLSDLNYLETREEREIILDERGEQATRFGSDGTIIVSDFGEPDGR